MIPEEKLQELNSEFRSKYYNAVSNCCFELLSNYSEDELDRATYEKIIDNAHEWFITHFFDENNI